MAPPKKQKKVTAVVKLQLPAGQATPQPPVGTALGPHGVAIGEFTKQYNEKTSKLTGQIIPVEITIYADRSFDFILKTPPAAFLIRQAAGIEKGSAEPNKIKVATISKQQCRDIAERKLADLNAHDLEAGARMIEGTARSMGVNVE